MSDSPAIAALKARVAIWRDAQDALTAHTDHVPSWPEAAAWLDRRDGLQAAEAAAARDCARMLYWMLEEGALDDDPERAS